ncbi:cobaltochelatase subunit CobN [Oscillatoria sp. FACHB-1406]|uniref:cobaltochelatase subunit CobN n=1 Tax=Oscillatoria sp. FACHB-1406 TaxID=2692846 RepID=UPI001682EFED|nr:cobaltochelatase subunit CobN [Oscillatoria sp. FACHB-1406]MBD2576574.1 cobaltochelatase subunit CobN [Oscillatoria sp. FACHB-1406]
MHRIAATPGGWNPNAEGVIFIEQTAAPIVFLTAADTDIQTLAAAISHLPEGFPAIRCANLLQLQQQLSIDTYAETVLSKAKVIILRLLGGRSYWSYGLEVVKEVAAETGAALLILPGDDRADPTLMSHSTLALAKCDRVWQYLVEGGVENYTAMLQFVTDLCLNTSYNPPSPQEVPRIGFYRYARSERQDAPDRGKVGLLFYRAHYLAGNITPIEGLCQALIEQNLEPIPVFVSSLRDREIQRELSSYLNGIELLLNTTSFSLLQIDTEEQPQLWQQINIPVLQVILSGGTEEQWAESFQGLSPRDMAMNVALPEVDGRVITRAISFKSVQVWNAALETEVVTYQPRSDRVNFVAELAASWVQLKQTSVRDRKVALILANYPNKDARLANGVGLDTPESCVQILQEMQAAGYTIDRVPATGDELIAWLTAGRTNDLEGQELRPVWQELRGEEFGEYFRVLPVTVRQRIEERWGQLKEGENFAIAGIQLGNIFVGIQPSRGYDRDPSLNYHAPDLEPTPDYLAFYHWLRSQFHAQAIVHVGKHGNLEWLPGKSIALSENCFPEVALGAIPHFYPFIVNDPGEGSQAKRRAAAVILDHLTPPLTRAELYGSLQKLEGLIDEYYEAQTLDPSRLKLIGDRIIKLARQENIDRDLGADNLEGDTLTRFLSVADGYLCELKEAQIRDGLHIFGVCPEGRQLRDLIVAIARHPGQNRLGLTRALAADFNLDFDPLTANYSHSAVLPEFLAVERFHQLSQPSTPAEFFQSFCAKNEHKPRTWGDVVEIIEQIAAYLVETLLLSENSPLSIIHSPLSLLPLSHKELTWIQTTLLPALQQTPQEITNLLRGLEGQYIPSGPSGAPTRGRAEVLPTGRNFYSVDIRAIPTETAWDTGRKAAEAAIERYAQENGEYPQTLALSVWGTSTMRTGGDDVAQVLALLGTKPIWDGLSRRVVDFEILTLSALGRPRVDVTLRVSGFFRDSFPNLIKLVYDAIAAVSSLNEPPEQNPLAAKVKQDKEFWLEKGLETREAEKRALYRIFGSKPGAYGAGLQGLIEAQNWETDEDLARAYLNWSSYAYTASASTGRIKSTAAPESFSRRLQQLQIVLHNQDNREHDLLDSDDYYQFQGGLTAAVRSLTGKNPTTYFGDNSIPTHPRVRHLKEEVARVYRSRVVNPKWIAGVMRHGYKGAFEMAATVDYLFAYDATARCVEDFMYEGVAKAYLFDPEVQNFIQQKNPWALRDMAERLIEAHQRKLWSSASPALLEQLRGLVHEAEGVIETMDN